MYSARSVRLMMCLLLIAITAACTKTVNWSEDVQLPDGRVVTLKRHQEFGGPHEIGQPPGVSDRWFEFKHPDTGQIVRWENKGDLSADVLLIDKTVPQLIVVPMADSLMRLNCPAPPYLLFEFENGRWVEKPLTDIRGLIVQPNLTNNPTEWLELKKRSDRHLTREQTMAGAYGATNGRRIDFGKLVTQTYGMKGCNPPFDFLPEASGEK